MEPRTVRETQVVMAHRMMPQHTNAYGNVHGGEIMKLIDQSGGVVASRHARSNVVTASIDRLDFHHAVHVGDILFCKASINMVGRTSMEIGVRVEAENPRTGQVRHTASAYLTLVALGEDGKPQPVPPLLLETDEERRRNHEAEDRRRMRLAERKRENGSR